MSMASGCATNHTRHLSRSSCVYRSNSSYLRFIARPCNEPVPCSTPWTRDPWSLEDLGRLHHRQWSEVERLDPGFDRLAIADDHHRELVGLDVLVGGAL